VKFVRGKKFVEEGSKEFNGRTKSGYVSKKSEQSSDIPGTSDGLKRKLPTRSPFVTPRKVKVQVKSPPRQATVDLPRELLFSQAGRPGFRQRAMKHIENSNYGTAVRLLLSKSDRAFGQITGALDRMIQDEVKSYRKTASIPTEPLSLRNLENLNWQNVLNEAEEALPIFWKFLTSFMCPNSRKIRVDIYANPMVTQVPALGFVIFSALYSRYPQRFKFFPSLNSIMLFKHGNSHAVSMRTHTFNWNIL
jgi:hypothetical protein